MGIPSSSSDSALHIVQSFTSPVLADPSGCLPVRATSSSARKGIPVPSMPRYKVCGRETASRGFGVHTFIFGDLFSQSFCSSLHLLGLHSHACQFGQQRTSFLETYQSPHRPSHTRERRRERGIFYAQVLIARTVAVAAGGAVIVGALQS